MNVKDETYRILIQNRREQDGFQYTVPSPTSYPYQWLWDSCFHAIILTQFNIEDAKEELRSVVSHQFDNGMLPHMIYWKRTDVINIDWGTGETSSITQPPIIADAVMRVFEHDNDVTFLTQLYPALSRYYRYLLSRKRFDGGLLGIINPDESGEDNSPRFDAALGLPPANTLEENTAARFALIERNKECNFDEQSCMRDFFWVKDVPFNAFMVQNLRTLARLAEKMGMSDDVNYFASEAEILAQSMRRDMCEDGVYWSVYKSPLQKIKVLTWAIFAPLYAGLYTQEEAEYCIVRYLRSDRDFATPYLVPTVSLSDPAYAPQGFWRGPTWIGTNWFIYHGLRRYGFHDDAERIKHASHSLLAKSGFREQFDPITGEGLGARDFTWGGLILDML